MKSILITGGTDGIGLETAKQFAALGHFLLIHGRNNAKLSATKGILSHISGSNPTAIETYRADLSVWSEVHALGNAICANHTSLDILINNAGVFKTSNPYNSQNLDVRFVVNALAPYVLTNRLLPIMSTQSRIINLSSAAQQTVSFDALCGKSNLSDSAAYAQSKLALTMWSMHLAASLGSHAPAVIAVNPASFLATKMVKEAYGSGGNDLKIGADILVRAALSEEFADASGRYFDNDRGRFANPHPDALDESKNAKLVQTIDSLLSAVKD